MQTRLFRAAMVALVAALAALWIVGPVDLTLAARLWWMPLVGVIGSGIAAMSGTGGGVVFIPVFHALRAADVLALPSVQVTAASFAIQCFGMGMGALRWTAMVRDKRTSSLVAPRDFWRVVASVLVIALPVMLATQRLVSVAPSAVLIAFKGFSLLLGLALLVSIWVVRGRAEQRTALEPVDMTVIALLGVAGGIANAFFSVGAGEIVALWLFIRRYPPLISSGAATVIAAASAWSGVVFHIEAGHVPWTIVALVAIGALVGGYIGRPVALALGPIWLKTIVGLWVAGSSLALIVMAVG